MPVALVIPTVYLSLGAAGGAEVVTVTWGVFKLVVGGGGGASGPIREPTVAGGPVPEAVCMGPEPARCMPVPEAF